MFIFKSAIITILLTFQWMVCNYGPGGNVVTPQTADQKKQKIKVVEQVYIQGDPVDEWWNAE